MYWLSVSLKVEAWNSWKDGISESVVARAGEARAVPMSAVAPRAIAPSRLRCMVVFSLMGVVDTRHLGGRAGEHEFPRQVRCRGTSPIDPRSVKGFLRKGSSAPRPCARRPSLGWGGAHRHLERQLPPLPHRPRRGIRAAPRR